VRASPAGRGPGRRSSGPTGYRDAVGRAAAVGGPPFVGRHRRARCL